jgi:preprotein translocase subunit SecG
MIEFLLVVHVVIAAAMIGVILLQRSEGGALGMGGGGGFMTGRGQANFLTRVTGGLAIAFFVTSILLTILAQRGNSGGSGILDRLQTQSAPASTTPAAGTAPAATTPSSTTTTAPAATTPATPAGSSTGGGILDKLEKGAKTP